MRNGLYPRVFAHMLNLTTFVLLLLSGCTSTDPAVFGTTASDFVKDLLLGAVAALLL